jgi:hypothetical protein
MQSTLTAAILILAGAIAFAQSNQGTITGTISDSTGGVVAAAAIEVRNVETGVVSRGGTSATGNYAISVPAGTYEITVTVTGFKKFVQTNVQVIVASDTRKDIALEVGAASEVITVEASAPLLKTESGEMSHRRSMRRIICRYSPLQAAALPEHPPWVISATRFKCQLFFPAWSSPMTMLCR